MKKIFSIVLFVIIGTSLFAQSDANATKLIKAVSHKYNNFKTMVMDVTLTIENRESKSKEERKGKVMVKGNKFNVNLDNQVIICDSKNTWVYLKDANEVQINDFDPKDEWPTPDKVLKIAEKDFTCYMGEKITEAGKTLQNIELVPLNKNANYSKIKLFINTADNSIVRGIMYDKNAMLYTYTINNFKGNGDVADTNFTFDKSKYPGVEVIDLRE
ncbi:MAG: outer membrane lipoprotein carrier protein LolA [Fimbriimonadaceae bacterium]|nr:outer membrane lipoprotein carrier protein LolA [Chitinophagales bacterium]